MRKLIILTLSTLVIFTASLHAQMPNTFLVKPERLVALKSSFQKGDSRTTTLINSLLKTANSDLKRTPVSVTSKKKIPTGGNIHDYMSMAPYFWPDSTKPNLLPYINKDGQFNPEIYTVTDHQYIQELERWVQDLALAYYFTDEEKYAAKASQFLQVWFIDTATLMNPNLNYAQAIMGLNEGRASGMIDACELTTLLNAVELLAGSVSWTTTQDLKLKEWFEQYYTWLLESKNGIAERKNKNNHGPWYDQQIVAVALYLGKKDWAKEYLNNTILRIPVQIEPDGRMPLELSRTNALHYNTFAIEAWFRTATLADYLGMDLWNYTTTDGRSFHKAFNWLLPYATGEMKWEYQQINEYKKKTIYKLLLQAANHYGGNYYQQAQKVKDGSDNTITDIFYDKMDK